MADKNEQRPHDWPYCHGAKPRVEATDSGSVDTAEPGERELGEVVTYAIGAYKKSMPVDKIFTLTPTDANGYMGAYIARAIEHHRPARSAPSKSARAIADIPARVWWNEQDKHPVFNNMNGADLILRKDVLAALDFLIAARVAGVRKDAERMDFLEVLAERNEDSMPNIRAYGKTFMGETLRDAVDAAMAATQPKEGGTS